MGGWEGKEKLQNFQGEQQSNHTTQLLQHKKKEDLGILKNDKPENKYKKQNGFTIFIPHKHMPF